MQKEIFEKIRQFETIIIHRHERPDPDAIGAQCGLREILRASFPEKKVVAVGSSVASLEFLAKMDQVADSDYREALVIVLDTANTERICDSRFRQGSELIKIDHHPNDDPYGALMWVEEARSSTCELLVQFYLDFSEELVLPAAAARLLYAGMVGDTGRFLYSSTTPETLRLAAFLMEFSFDASKVNQELSTIPMKLAKLSGEAYQNIHLDENGAAYVLLSAQLLKCYKVSDSETSAIVSLPGHVEEVVSWVIFVEQPNGNYRVRLRSKAPAIHEIAKRHNGGGHRLASGAKAKNKAEVLEIYRELQEVVKEWKESNH